MPRKNFINQSNVNQVVWIVDTGKEGSNKPQVIVIFVCAEQETPHRQTIQKVHRNPIVWRGKYINVSRTASGRLQPHFRELSLGDILERDLFPYKVAAELYQAQKDLKVNLVEGSGLNLNPTAC